MGEQIKLARLRRGLTAELAADRQAREILAQVKENWERLARQYGLPRNEIETMRPAFSECYK